MSKPHVIYHFAHRQEAQAFLKEGKFTAKSEGVYFEENEKIKKTLLISGEGVFKTTLKLTQLLSELKTNDSTPTHLLHLGVCGHIKREGESFEIGEPVSLRSTLYSPRTNKLAFKTFTSAKRSGDLPYVDIISVQERVLSKTDHEGLTPFASLVDRESWAAFQVADHFNLPAFGIKVVSDFADGEICQSVKEDAYLWSDTLFRETWKWEQKVLSLTPNLTVLAREKTYSFPELHITLSQERTLTSLLKALFLKGMEIETIKDLVNYQEIIESKGHPKNKTKTFISRLQEILNPLEKSLKEKLATQSRQLEQAGFSVRYDQGYERDLLHLNITLHNDVEKKRAATALDQFDFTKLTAILNPSSKDSDHV